MNPDLDSEEFTLTGFNIQWPWSNLLLSGEKTIETRNYPLPARYHRTWLALIETPGQQGKKQAGIDTARIAGIIKFSHSYLYKTGSQWLSDQEKHLVSANDPLFSFSPGREKWGWVVQQFFRLSVPQPAPKRKGIIFTNNCRIHLARPHLSHDFHDLLPSQAME